MPTILLVDADEDSRASYARALSGAGYQTDTAASGADAIERLRATSPDLVVTQGWLGDIDATQVIGGAHVANPARRVPFLVLAGSHGGIGVAAAGAGADRVCAGHVSVTGLLEHVGNLIGPGAEADPPAPPAPQPEGPAEAAPARPSSAEEFQGSLGVMDLPALAQAMSIGTKTGRLTLFLQAGDGIVRFEHGLPVHAEFAGGTGEAAFAAMVWASQEQGGTFRFEPTTDGSPADARTIHRSAERLLLDVAAWLDEDRLAGRVPEASATRSAQK